MEKYQIHKPGVCKNRMDLLWFQQFAVRVASVRDGPPWGGCCRYANFVAFFHDRLRRMSKLQERNQTAALQTVERLLFESLPLGVFLLDHRGVVLAINHQQEVNSGIARGEVVGRPITEMFGSVLQKYGLVEPLERLLAEGTPFRTEIERYEPQFLRKMVRFRLWGYSLVPGELFVVLTDGVDTEHPRAPEIVGESDAMEPIYWLIERAARVDATALILGETGTGKELVARAIHSRSARRRGPFLAVNCGALPEPLLEGALFGHERGAFTGAERRVKGYFEAAHGGTLLLDEIGETSPAFQVKLLRVLESGRVTRLGGTAPIETDVRVLCATNRNLEDEVQVGRFRKDLYYRINVLQIRLPALRERIEDLPLLVTRFLHEAIQKHGLGEKTVSQPALERLRSYAWPGNVRELANVIESAYIVAPGRVLQEHHLPRRILEATSVDVEAPLAPGGVAPYEEARRRFQRQYLKQLLRLTGGDMKAAARIAGVHPSTLYRIQGRS